MRSQRTPKGWVILQLPAGRYELICNIAGHLRRG
jgi:uncharacterized cupredoxin-like copper-binding protein